MKFNIAVYVGNRLHDKLLAIGIDERDAMITAAWTEKEVTRVEWREEDTRQWAQTILPFGLKRT